MRERMQAQNRRVVVTGIGMMSALGLERQSNWAKLMAGQHGISPIEAFDTSDFRCHLAAEIKDFDPSQYFSRKDIRHTDRFTMFALVAAQEAMADAGLAELNAESLSEEESFRSGVIVSSGIGGLWTLEEESRKLQTRGPRAVSPYFIPMMIGNMAPGVISMRYGFRGVNIDITTACASGAHAIGEAFRRIKYGELDRCISGGAEATITPLALAGFGNMTALTSSDDPDRASIPFDAERSGFVMGEGAAILLLEEREMALARGAHIYGEISGYGATGDAYHMTSPDPDGRGALAAMRLALREAGLEASTVGYINAHGTATPTNDRVETRAIHQLMGDLAQQVAVSSTKSMTGHMLGAAGAYEAAVCLMALEAQRVPGTLGYRVADPECDLDYVTEGARDLNFKVALSNSLGFGGHNATLLFEKHEEA